MGAHAVTSSSPVYTMIDLVKLSDVAQDSSTSVPVSSPVLEHLTTQTAEHGDQTRTFWVIDTATDTSGPTATWVKKFRASLLLQD